MSSQFINTKDGKSLWRDIQILTDYKPARQACENDTSVLNLLIDLFAFFEHNTKTENITSS